jgi:pimeloyl-ACP methyl ester carboxylesterase
VRAGGVELDRHVRLGRGRAAVRRCGRGEPRSRRRNDARAANPRHAPRRPRFRSHAVQTAVLLPLKEVAQVVYYDHRGNGRSDRGSPERWTLDQWADDVFELCTVLGIEHPVVFGGSFGGFVALTYAVRYPEHPARLILSSTTAHIHLERSFAMFERLGGPEARKLAERFWTQPRDEDFDEYTRVCLPLYTQRPQPPEVLPRVTRNIEVAKHFRMSGEMRFDLRNRMGAIRCPVLVMAGVLDPMVTIEDARELAAALPEDRTTFLEFENAGHMLALEQPEQVVGAMIDFITSV